MSWGGSSLAGPVLTVSTQPEKKSVFDRYRESSECLTGDGKLALTLQESRVGSDELLRLQSQNPLA